jgi:hypothetical protein
MTFPISRSLLAAAAASLLAPLSAQAASAANCPGLTSGAYVALNTQETDVAWKVNLLTIDAKKLIITESDGSTTKLTAGSELCAFSMNDGVQLKVANASGIFMVQTQNAQPAVGLPVQALKLKQLAGTWNFMRQEKDTDGVFYTYNGLVKITAKGSLSVALCDAAGLNCGKFKATSTVAANAAGGFTVTNLDGKTERAFALAKADGSMMMIMAGVDTTAMTVTMPVTAKTLPDVGDSWGAWEMKVAANGAASAIATSTYTVTQTDVAAGTFTRQRAEDCMVDTWHINSGRNGMNQRPAAGYTKCDGSSSNYSNNLAMNMRDSFGFGVHGWDSASTRYFGYTIARP